tara:strand:+ start:196 stop:312 length:117 start_codon:yes stop_codon:yes gene_type:complete
MAIGFLICIYAIGAFAGIGKLYEGYHLSKILYKNNLKK